MAYSFSIHVNELILECLREGDVIRLDVNGEATYVKWCLYGYDENEDRLVVIFSDSIAGELHAGVYAVKPIEPGKYDEVTREVEEAVTKYWFGWVRDPPTYEGIVRTIIKTLKKHGCR